MQNGNLKSDAPGCYNMLPMERVPIIFGIKII